MIDVRKLAAVLARARARTHMPARTIEKDRELEFGQPRVEWVCVYSRVYNSASSLTYLLGNDDLKDQLAQA